MISAATSAAAQAAADGVTPADGLDSEALTAFVARRHAPAGGPLRPIRLDVHPLRGGQQAAAVAHVRARFPAPGGRERTASFVVKRLQGAAVREAAVYEALAALGGRVPSPRLLGTQRGDGKCYLYLQHVRSWRRWPWGDAALAGLVLEELARLHEVLAASGAAAVAEWGNWDYEAELQTSAAATLDVLQQVAGRGEVAGLRRALPAVRRTVAALPAVRRQLLGAGSLGCGVLHGDTHPGNVVLVAAPAGPRPVLLDWGRARLGSPLEDVSSWLHSLGMWEPEARRRHDTLLRRYLVGRGMPDRLDRPLRDLYWLAGACNALAGALRYHLAVADGWRDPAPRARADAARAAHIWLRIVRRADACWWR